MLLDPSAFEPQTRASWSAEAQRVLGARPLESLLWEVEPGIVLDPIYFPGEVEPLSLPLPRAAEVVQFVPRAEALTQTSLDAADAVYVAEGGAAAQTDLPVYTPPAWGDVSTGLDGLTLREAGATRVETLAWLLAQHHALSNSSDTVRVTTGVGPEWAAEIAFLRALRHLLGDSDVHLLVLTLRYYHTAVAPHTNLLRNTLGASAALLGGADALCVYPHDALAGATSNGRRLARQTHLLLRDESHLDRIADAAGGAYAIDALTRKFVEAARARYAEIEAGGGHEHLHASPDLGARVEAQHQARQQAVLDGKARIVGVTRSPDVHDEVPPLRDSAAERLATRRLAAPFEHLRSLVSAAGPVHLYLFGDKAQASARAGFAREFFGIAGVSTADVYAVDDLPPDATTVVLCAADADYAAEGAQRLNQVRLRAPNATPGIAGKPDSERALGEAGAAFFIHARAPLYPHLRETLAALHLLD